MKDADKLRVTWGMREADCMIHFPLGISTKSDGHWLSGIFNKDFTDQLTARGYNLATLKFSVEPHPTARPDKFASIYKKTNAT